MKVKIDLTFAGYAAIPSLPALVLEIHCLTLLISSMLAPALPSVVIVTFFSSIMISSSGSDSNADPPPVMSTTIRSSAVADVTNDITCLAEFSELLSGRLYAAPSKTLNKDNLLKNKSLKIKTVLKNDHILQSDDYVAIAFML